MGGAVTFPSALEDSHAAGNVEYRSEAERVARLRAIAFVGQMHDLALSAPSGQVLDLCDGQALDREHASLGRRSAEANASRKTQAWHRSSVSVSVMLPEVDKARQIVNG